MRIIAGEKRGARLASLPGEDTRPTLERVKEGIFSAVQFLLPGARVLDLFAGSGQLGLEALSRGAQSCVFIDEDDKAAGLVIANAKTTGLFEKSRVARMSAAAFLAGCREKFDLVFLDPPYKQGTFPGILPAVAAVCAPGAVVLCESEPGVAFPEEIDGLALQKQYKYGTVVVRRYRMAPEE